MPASALPSWSQLESLATDTEQKSIKRLFQQDPSRASRYALDLDGMFLDYSKHRVDDAVMQALLKLTEEADLAGWRQRMFAGEAINHTENRAVLHTALRDPQRSVLQVDGHNVMPDIRTELARMRHFADQVRSGSWLGFTGKAITQVVNIGIGGSSLGPEMALSALAPYQHPELQMFCVSNVDAAQIDAVLAQLDPERCLFIIASKQFNTQETLRNANTARDWLLHQHAGDTRVVARHCVAVSTHAERVQAFGIDVDNMFRFWDWVGGRYSIWSAIGLPLAIAFGMDAFERFLAGAHAMDEHFQHAPHAQNAPVILALLGIWYHNFMTAESCAVIPYDQRLHRFPAYLQQLDMESNGKSCDRQGQRVRHATGATVWGEPGTNGQHAFFQLLHQGSSLIPVDFIAALNPHHSHRQHHDILIANCLAQSEALMNGRTADEVTAQLRGSGLTEEEIALRLPYQVFDGNRPSTTILLDELSPYHLGQLTALYEHKVFVQSVIWNINAFDQWGVELGKQLASQIMQRIIPSQPAEPACSRDSSTEQLLQRYLDTRNA